MEHGNILLTHAMLYLAAAVAAAVAAHRLGLASVAGYLIAGSGLVVAAAAFVFGADWRLAVVAGAALALSSTALALQPLTERGALGSKGGQATFAVLLFQDIAAIPMLALLPRLQAHRPHAVGADEADLLVITLDRAEDITRLAGIVKKHFPRLRVVSRAHDMRHMFELRDLGVEVIERETWLGALELGEAALAMASGAADRAGRLTRAFAEHDLEVQAKLSEVHRKDPGAQVAVSNELRDQLARTLREDSPR
jgi:predicted Kef-type K+ transport protein